MRFFPKCLDSLDLTLEILEKNLQFKFHCEIILCASLHHLYPKSGSQLGNQVATLPLHLAIFFSKVVLPSVGGIVSGLS